MLNINYGDYVDFRTKNNEHVIILSKLKRRKSVFTSKINLNGTIDDFRTLILLYYSLDGCGTMLNAGTMNNKKFINMTSEII